MMRGPDTKATARARSLRQADNDAEAILWSELRGRRLNGHKFVRQLPIGKYFADFACREIRLVIEADGSQHADSDRDKMRDQFMNEAGWSVLRIWANEVISQRQSVLETIVAACEGKLLEPVQSLDLRFNPSSNPSDHLLCAGREKGESK